MNIYNEGIGKMMVVDATSNDIDGMFEVFKDYEEQENNTANILFANQGLAQLPLEIDEKEEKCNFEKLIKDSKRKVVIAKKDDLVLGYAYGWIKGEDFYDETKQKGLIDTVAVKKEQRGKGIGSKLCDILEEWLSEQGCVSIDIHCFYLNEGARKLYKRRGYSDVILIMNKSLHKL